MPKVLVIGWDAADWKIINALVDQGKMPHTARLMERGTMGDLATLHPVLSPMLWTSIATGKRPYKHGIHGFSEPTPDGGSVQPVSQLSRTTKALWNILNQSGKRSHVIGWWPSHPVEPINGVMVSNHYHTAVGPPDQPWPLAPGMVHPRRLEETLAELRINPNELIPEQVLPFVPRAAEIDQDKDRRLGSVMKILAECASVQAAATWAMEHEPWDFMGVYFDAIDHFCHGFMKYHPPRQVHVPERDFELYSGVVNAGYMFHDMMLGAMLELAPEDTTVLICSDHGFHSDHLRPVQLPREPAAPAIEHRDLGMILMAGPNIKRDHLIHGANLLDITPTLLTLFGLPVGEDMDGKPLLDAFVTPPEVSIIPSWDTVAGDDARIAGEFQYDPIAAKEAMDQLVALGYVEAPGEDLDKAIRNTVQEMRYNLARAWMDGGFYARGAEILAGLFADAPEEYRFGVHQALCHQALNQVKELRELVERMTVNRRAAAENAGQELKTWREAVLARQQEAGQLTADNEIDQAHLSEEERNQYNDLRLTARFSHHDLDFLMSWVLRAEGKPAEALAHLQRAAATETRRPTLFIQIGETLGTLKKWPEAEATFRRALALDPRNPHALLGAGKSCLRQGRVEEGLALVLDSIGCLYQNPMAHYILGLGLLRMKQYFRAIEAMQVAVSLNPNFERAHRFIARYVLRMERDREKSEKHWRIVREIRARKLTERQADRGEIALLAEELSGDAEQERRAPALDLTPLVDKNGVPDDPARCITVVAGLPRSGTSMMMQMLAAGGLPVLSDGKREADEDNPRGYLELEAATRLRQNQDWLDEALGQVVKIVAQLLPFLPARHPYKVVFMERDIQEVLRSQKTMLGRLDRDGGKLTDEQLEAAYRRQLKQVGIWLARQPNVKTLFVSHRETLGNPQQSARRVAEFVGGGLDVDAMAAAVDGTLYRQRAVVA